MFSIVYKCAVSFILPMMTVLEVVTDQLRVNTRAIITAEVTRLRDLKVKVERPELDTDISAVAVQKIPMVETEWEIVVLICLHVGEHFTCVGVNNLPPRSSIRKCDCRLNVTKELSRTLHNKETVYRTLETDSSQNEILIRRPHFADRARETTADPIGHSSMGPFINDVLAYLVLLKWLYM